MSGPTDRQPGWRTANRPLPPRSGVPAPSTVPALGVAPASVETRVPVADVSNTVGAPVASGLDQAAAIVDDAVLAAAARGSGGPLPPRPVAQPAWASATQSVPATPTRSVVQSPPPSRAAGSAPRSRPDAKPMRIVFGAGAVAAMSAMTVGLVQPDFSGLADEAAPAGDTGAQTSSDEALNGNPNGSGRGVRETEGRRVVRYVFLRPGADAPDGARVITAAEAARRGIAPGNVDQEPPRSRGATGTATQPDRPNSHRPSQAQPTEPRNNQPAAPRPERPDPPVRTHQSGG